MKVTIILGLVAFILAVGGLIAIVPDEEVKPGSAREPGVVAESAGSVVPEKGPEVDSDLEREASAGQSRADAMKSAFAELQDTRKKLKSRANLLKSRIWGLEMPAEQAKMVTNSMKQSYVYLKNPAMLGAYFDLNEIRREIRSVNAMLEDLENADSVITEFQARDPG